MGGNGYKSGLRSTGWLKNEEQVRIKDKGIGINGEKDKQTVPLRDSSLPIYPFILFIFISP